MSLFERIRREATDHPLRLILLCAATIRLVAVIFAKGYMASDDYFVYFNVPVEWTRGNPVWFNMDHPSGFSLVYPGFNWLTIIVPHALGIMNPEVIMFLNRLLHAAWSLVGVAAAYRLTLYATEDRTTAVSAGLMAAFFSFLPYGSVRNLPEMVCAPFVMLYLFHTERATRENRWADAFLGGLAIAAAFVFRYQSLLFGGGAVLFLFRRQWKATAAFALGMVLPMVFQGTVDLIAYGSFFAAPLEYFSYNIAHSTDYVVGPWYRYLLLFAGMFIPPFSFLFLPATFGAWKKAPVTLLSTVAFVFIHSATPAKQERFVIPALLPIIVLGCIGMMVWMKSPAGARFETPVRWLRRWFWGLNILLLLLFTFHYGKRGQIEALNDLRRIGDVRYLAVDRTDKHTFLPLFFLGVGEDRCYWISDSNDWAFVERQAKVDSLRPNYALVNVPNNIEDHVRMFAEHGIKAEVLQRYGPGPLEWLLAKGNPRFNSTNEVWTMKLSYPPAADSTHR